eukprot:3935234-Prymnesium_polylepis.1
MAHRTRERLAANARRLPACRMTNDCWRRSPSRDAPPRARRLAMPSPRCIRRPSPQLPSSPPAPPPPPPPLPPPARRPGCLLPPAGHFSIWARVPPPTCRPPTHGSPCSTR